MRVSRFHKTHNGKPKQFSECEHQKKRKTKRKQTSFRSVCYIKCWLRLQTNRNSFSLVNIRVDSILIYCRTTAATSPTPAVPSCIVKINLIHSFFSIVRCCCCCCLDNSKWRSQTITKMATSNQVFGLTLVRLSHKQSAPTKPPFFFSLSVLFVLRLHSVQ